MGEAPLPQRARGYWKTWFSATGGELEKLLERERAQPPPWFVVGFGSGIAAWFALGEPWQWQAFACLAAAASLTGFGLGAGRAGRALGWFALAAALGCGLVWFATAFATGNQNAISQDDADAMRRGGIAHRLSVGGLHITAVVGLTMLLTLRLLALSPWLALRLNLLVIASAAGAVAAIGYTLLTGSQVPMVRSCIVAVLVLAGMWLGREAISVRLLAVSGLLILAVQPEAIVGPSFQMTFAAVGAIVALHSSAWARRMFQRRDEHLVRRIVRAAAAIVVTGTAVELCVMPFVLYHFHRAGAFGVVANVVVIPLTELLIMPLLLWTTRMRLVGLLPIAIGAVATFATPRPDLLITGDGRHLAVVSSDGTPLVLRDRAGDYVRSLLAEASGFDGDPGDLASLPYSDCSDDACVAVIPK